MPAARFCSQTDKGLVHLLANHAPFFGKTPSHFCAPGLKEQDVRQNIPAIHKIRPQAPSPSLEPTVNHGLRAHQQILPCVVHTFFARVCMTATGSRQPRDLRVISNPPITQRGWNEGIKTLFHAPDMVPAVITLR